MTDERWAQYVLEKREEFLKNEQDWQRDFDRFISTNHQAQAVTRVAFGDDDHDDLDLLYY